MDGIERFKNSLRQLGAGVDDNLREYFTVTKAIQELADFSSDKVLAIGLKGVGKTAAFRYLTEIDTNCDLVIGITPQPSTKAIRNPAANALILPYQAQLPQIKLNYAVCQEQFEYDLVMECIKLIANSKPLLTDKVSKELFTKIESEYSRYRKLLEGLKKALSRFRGISVLGCGFSIGEGRTTALTGVRDNREISDSYALLEDATKSGITIRIVIDDPELVLSASQELDGHLLAGFFLAALSLSRRLPNLKIVVLVKTHVFFQVTNPDFDKFPDREVFLSWNAEELINILDSRMEWAGVKWEQIFELKREESLELLQEKIFARIRNGPRDLLRWMDLALDRSYPQDKVSKDTFALVERSESSYILQSMQDAFSALYPGLRTIVRGVFRGVESRQFTAKEFKDHIRKLFSEEQVLMNLARQDFTGEINSFDLPQVLFKVGALAIGYGDRLILPYEREYDTRHFEDANYLCLVPGLISAISGGPSLLPD